MATTNPHESDLASIRALAEVLDETGLTEIEIERGDVRIRIARGAVTSVVSAAPQPVMSPVAGGGMPVAGGDGDVSPSLSGHPGAVTSPMVGTAYMASQPGAAPFVTVGSTVAAGQTVMIVEAMKTMNEIKAPRAGRVTQIIVQDSAPVEFGEVLMIIE